LSFKSLVLWAASAFFLHIAMGSTAETDYHLLLTYVIKFLSVNIYQIMTIELIELTESRPMMNAFTQRLKTKNE